MALKDIILTNYIRDINEKIEIENKIKKLYREIGHLESRLQEYPQIGDIIQHISEGDPFILTSKESEKIDFYDDWSYYRKVEDE